MIDRQHGEIVFHCDGCSDCLETGERDWNDAMASFGGEGWKSLKVGDEWVHLCPLCKMRAM